jgi:hypothetical protein
LKKNGNQRCHFVPCGVFYELRWLANQQPARRHGDRNTTGLRDDRANRQRKAKASQQTSWQKPERLSQTDCRKADPPPG